MLRLYPPTEFLLQKYEKGNLLLKLNFILQNVFTLKYSSHGLQKILNAEYFKRATTLLFQDVVILKSSEGASPLYTVISASGFASGATHSTVYFFPATQDAVMSMMKYGFSGGTADMKKKIVSD